MKTVEGLKEIVLQNSPHAWWEWDAVNNTVISNDIKVTMLGYDAEIFKEKGYEAYTALLHPDDLEKVMSAMRDLLTGRTPIYQVDYRIIDHSGKYHWYMDRGVVIAETEGIISRIRGIVIDLGYDLEIAPPMKALVNLLHRYVNDGVSYIAICSNCERIKIGEKKWEPFDTDLKKVISDTFTHGICPSCIRKLYPKYAERILNRMSEKE